MTTRSGAGLTRQQVQARLADEFSNDELDQLAFDLGFKEERLWGYSATIDERARTLTTAMSNRKRLHELMQRIERLRP